MKKLILISILALLAALAFAFSERPDWAFDAGVLFGFWATLAIIAALSFNSLIGQRNGGTGPFGPGLLTIVQTFWATMTVNFGLGLLILRLDTAEYRPESYAIGLGAFVPYAIVAMSVLVCLTFVLIRWWPLRLLLTTASGCTAAFTCMAATWWR